LLFELHFFFEMSDYDRWGFDPDDDGTGGRYGDRDFIADGKAKLGEPGAG